MARIDNLRRLSTYGSFPQAYQLYPVLAQHGMWLKGKLSNHGGDVTIEGVHVHIMDRQQALQETRERGRSFVQRVYAECDCGRMIPFGRLHQHRKSCKVEA